ncbi:hypothetical protein ZIOFF_046642 [Zingiber officinale]|uniref:EXPERA domain-containing protein n=1 Tax=Zingiber officinale TaxID=94328 RepID=A0A8J5FVU4_ZINOF|nr:hypothetical protein ZIOFF_046642 [Zingiber officinale]
MGLISVLIDAVVVVFSAVLTVTAPLFDAQTCLPKLLYPAPLVELKRWYAEEFGDYLVAEKPGFFTGLVWLEIAFLWPLSVANVYGIVARRPWATTTSLMAGVNVATTMAAIMGELLSSGKASDKLIRLYAPFMVFAFFAIIRGLLPRHFMLEQSSLQMELDLFRNNRVLEAADAPSFVPSLRIGEEMGHLRGLAQLPGPPAGVGLIVAPTRFSALCYSRPPSVVFPAPLGRRCYPSRPKVLLENRFDFLVGSAVPRITLQDMTSELELAKPDGSRGQNRPASGVFWILLLNLGIYVADHILQLVSPSKLHSHSDLFFSLYLKPAKLQGKLVEEEEGNFALWISYILTGAGANLVSWLLLPRSAVSLGASGAVFGLFAISVLVKMSWDWRKIIEVLILGQFVIDKVMEAAQASTNLTGTFGRGSFMAVNHIAHLSGALIGAALVLLVSRIPSQPYQKDIESVRHENKRP